MIEGGDLTLVALRLKNGTKKMPINPLQIKLLEKFEKFPAKTK